MNKQKQDLLDKIFLEIAQKISLISKDPSTKVGSVLVKDSRILAQGYNGFCSNYPDNYDIPREKKMGITIHSEINAILNAAKNGAKVDGATIYITEPPCSNCASALINAGIVRVVYPKNYTLGKNWNYSIGLSKELFSACNIETKEL